jgi:hypothetical protein
LAGSGDVDHALAGSDDVDHGRVEVDDDLHEWDLRRVLLVRCCPVREPCLLMVESFHHFP